MAVTIGSLVVADPPEAWEAAGFTVAPDATCTIGTVVISLVGRGRGEGIVGWSLRNLPSGLPGGVLDGLPTTESDQPPALPTEHPNGVVSIDHVVLLSPHLARTVDALAEIGLRPRRERNGDLGGRPMRQVFFRMGEVILEVVGSPNTVSEGPSTLWGLTHVVPDVNATAALFGDRAGRVKPAIQPGRRITTLRHDEFGMSVHTALISSDPRLRT